MGTSKFILGFQFFVKNTKNFITKINQETIKYLEIHFKLNEIHKTFNFVPTSTKAFTVRMISSSE